jgi:hypothetical protein
MKYIRSVTNLYALNTLATVSQHFVSILTAEQLHFDRYWLFHSIAVATVVTTAAAAVVLFVV